MLKNTTLISAIITQNVYIFWMKSHIKHLITKQTLKLRSVKIIKMSFLYITDYVPRKKISVKEEIFYTDTTSFQEYGFFF